MTDCPGCHAPVHPLLGDAPLVVGDRVVMCCSDSCREQVRERLSRVDPDPLAWATETLEPTLCAAVSAEPAAELPPRAAGARRLLSFGLVAVGVGLLLVAGYFALQHLRPDSDAKARPTRKRQPSPPARASSSAAPSRQVAQPRAQGPPEASGKDRLPRSLLQLKKRSWQLLESYLTSSSQSYRLTAAEVLAEAGHTQALVVLRQALKAPLWTTRQRAAEALARLRHADGVAALKQDLGARRKEIKWAAAFALARVGDRTGVSIIRALAFARAHRMTSAEALVKLGEHRERKVLLKRLRFSKARYDRLRAAVALGLAGDRSGLDLLKKQAAESQVHMGVALALQKLGAPEAQAALRRALDHTALRVEAARALRSYGDVTQIPEIAPQLASPSEDVRLTVAAAIVILTSQARAEVR